MEQIKKDFQKTIKEIRGERKFPKPMMTTAQMAKREATVNCGGEWYEAEQTLMIAKSVIDDKMFQDFIERYNAEFEIEQNNFKTYQIRIRF